MAYTLKEGIRWWAVKTRANFEWKVQDQLVGRSIETFLPTYRTYSKRKDRKKIIEVPLFSGYLFVHTELAKFDNRVAVLRASGVVKVIGSPAGPEPIPDDQIDNVVHMCTSDRLLEPWGRIEVGKPIRVISGGLSGVTGVVVDIVGKGRRIICNIDLLGRAVAAELRPEDIEPLGIEPKIVEP